MAKLKAAEPSLKKRAGSSLQRITKAARMIGEAAEEGTQPVAQVGTTARERSLNQEKEKQRRRAEEEKRQEARRLVREEALARIARAEKEMDRARAISEWIGKIETCPVFEPSEAEFKDPLKYIDKIASEVAPRFGICKVIPPGSYVNSVFMGRNLFRDPNFKMEVRKQPLRMVDWDNEEGASKAVNFNKDSRLWTVRQLEEFANSFVAENYDGSSSPLQLRIIEREFWKEFLLRRNKNVRYASDVPGTVFDPWEDLGRSRWNLGTLPTLPDSVLRIVETAIPGVTEPMLYVGMLFSMFAWHVEDQYLYSINYHHLGAPKTWYGVPGSAARDFERVAQEKVFNLPATPEGLARTLKLLIGKTIMFPPGLLVDAGVPVCRAVQQPGEFVITFPRSYHAGFSNGFNCGEAVNFAMPDWFPFGAACTRRYRLLRQVQVVAYDELLCKEAKQLYKRRAAQAAHSSAHQPTALELHTMVEFVRLLRWQHWQRWCLQQRGVPAQPILLLKSPAIECTLCHHKNYLAYVVCSCHGGPICLNHPDELAACCCQPQPPAPARKVHYLKKLPKLEAIAAAFEREPAVVAQLARAAHEEQHNPELRDEWRLGQRREDVIGDGSPHSAGAGYQRWAAIPGHSYEDGLAGKAVQPGNPTQQLGDTASEEASQGSHGKLLSNAEQAQAIGAAAKEAAMPCMAIQTVKERAPWSPAHHAPPGQRPASPPQPIPICAPQSPSKENRWPHPQALLEFEFAGESEEGVEQGTSLGGADERADWQAPDPSTAAAAGAEQGRGGSLPPGDAQEGTSSSKEGCHNGSRLRSKEDFAAARCALVDLAQAVRDREAAQQNAERALARAEDADRKADQAERRAILAEGKSFGLEQALGYQVGLRRGAEAAAAEAEKRLGEMARELDELKKIKSTHVPGPVGRHQERVGAVGRTSDTCSFDCSDEAAGVAAAAQAGRLGEEVQLLGGVPVPAGRTVSPPRNGAPRPGRRAASGKRIMNCVECSVRSKTDVPLVNHQCPFRKLSKGPSRSQPPLLPRPSPYPNVASPFLIGPPYLPPYPNAARPFLLGPPCLPPNFVRYPS